MGVFGYLKSTILSKIVMAVTGVILVLYIIVHLLGNLQIFIGKEPFNAYAHFLHSIGEVLWIIRGILLLAFILHVITSVRLYFLNKSARDVNYKVRDYIKAKLSSRTMIWTGLMMLAFIVYHLLHFTIGTADSENFGKIDYYDREAAFLAPEEGGNIIFEGSKYKEIDGAKVVFERHDAYYMVIRGFQQPIISIIYIIAMLLLGFHLNHAIQSMFQTLGISGPKFTPAMIKCSTWLSIILVIGYISIPITILFGLVGGAI